MKNKERSEALDSYWEQLKALQRASEVMAGLRERAEGLEKRASELAFQAASLLDSDGQEEQESAIEAKLARAKEKLAAAEGGLSAQISGVRGEFSRLHLIFKLHRIEIEKARLQQQMVSGCPNLNQSACPAFVRGRPDYGAPDRESRANDFDSSFGKGPT